MLLQKEEKIMENIYKEVDFETYCETCEHKDLKENFDPCNDCLGEPMNANSEKPVYWKEADNGRQHFNRCRFFK